ncbi:MAG: bifunctional hydroxymethylpyrimidine kinase/phosphomethylpyrimidine kinase [Prevotella sp.]|nr:bifunctional hydroxymethylpyrimidine kinase/phosphomethylpyrimidine kinase [Prevotella sp.]
MKTILTIAASDTSAGAGIQQDLKTITSLGHYGVTAITALTAQNTRGVEQVMEVPTDFFRAQLSALFSDINIDAIKIGVIPNREIAAEIVALIPKVHVPVVLDPVLASTSGWNFLDAACVEYIKNNLIPLCTLVTPNIPETIRLLEAMSSDTPNIHEHQNKETSFSKKLGNELVARFHTSFLVKGGHAEGIESIDTLYTTDNKVYEFKLPRIDTHNLHGTGCTLSTAIATNLATGLSLPDSVRLAKETTLKGIIEGKNLKIGHGNGPLWLSQVNS